MPEQGGCVIGAKRATRHVPTDTTRSRTLSEEVMARIAERRVKRKPIDHQRGRTPCP